jgi:transcriptional regulator with XRE-family HTH domain
MTLIREKRLELKLTQTDVALVCGVSLAAYILWEKGVSKPKYQNQQKLIECLNLPVGYFDK